MQARAVQNADELASQKDLLQVEVDALKQEMGNVKEQLEEQQVRPALCTKTRHNACMLKFPSSL